MPPARRCGNYWSSSQGSSANAWNTNNGNPNLNPKGNAYLVRPLYELHYKHYMRHNNHTTHEAVSLEEVFSAYYDCRRHKRNTHRAVRFEVFYEDELVMLHEELNARTYTIAPSRAFVVTRPKLREVFAADFRDRIVHHILCNRLLPYIEGELIADTYACRRGRGPRKATERFVAMLNDVSEYYTKQAWCLCGDVRNFFMSLDKAIVLERVQRIIQQHWCGSEMEFMLWLSALIINHEPQHNCSIHSPASLWDALPSDKSLMTAAHGKGMPIGNLPSQLFANIVLSDFDHDMVRMFGTGRYIRYADDFRILSTDKRAVMHAMPVIRSKLSDVGLTLHPRKWSLQEVHKGSPFAGVVVKPHRTYVRGRLLHDMLRSAEIAPTAERAYRSLSSYFGHMKGRATFRYRRQALTILQARFPRRFTGGKNLNRIYLNAV